jgi:ADP-heptose:LPS heptosyltransferase
MIHVVGMHGMGDNLHQRSIMRELMRSQEVWLETPWPSVYHDLVGPRLHLVCKGSSLRTQAKNAVREAASFDSGSVPANARVLQVSYSPATVRQQRGVLAAMSARCRVPMGDFRLPVPAGWSHGLELPDDRPVLVVRPLVERKEWSGCPARNPQVNVYVELLQAIRERFFVVSVADLQPGAEWLAQPDIGADITLHAGELDFRGLAALWFDADMVYTAPGFGLVLAQAVGTPVVGVFGGYEAAYSFSAGARFTPTLAVEPATPCDCFKHTHRCDKRIDKAASEKRLLEFIDAHCPPAA